MKKNLTSFLLIGVAILLSLTTNAQWSNNPNLNTAVCTATNGQDNPGIISDGLGGAILVWQDSRSGVDQDIYAQRLNAQGVPLWTVNGVAICTASGDQYNPTLVSDGAGGAIITWDDYRLGNADVNVFAQRINSLGVTQWTVNGLAVCNAVSTQENPIIVTDGSGGAIISWDDYRSATGDIYAQRLDANGNNLWVANGVAICTAINDQYEHSSVADNSGGAIITWRDLRTGPSIDDIYAQKINAAGAVQWLANGVVISAAANYQAEPKIVSDNLGGGIIVWEDNRVASNTDIYAQRVNSSGIVQWTSNGVAICTAANNQGISSVPIAVDGSGGAIITWSDGRNPLNYDVYAQRINASGVTQWLTNGAAVSTATNTQGSSRLVSDNFGNSIITWQDNRNGIDNDIYAQKLNPNGSAQWASNGIAVSTATNSQSKPLIASDNLGNVILTWDDIRLGYEIYAQNICVGGNLGGLLPSAPTNTTAASNQTICVNNTTTLSATGTGTLTWYTSAVGGSLLATGANFTTPVLNTTTTYYVQDSTNCNRSLTRTAVTVTVNSCVGIKENFNTLSVTIYPNPTNSSITIQSSYNLKSILVLDVSGRVIINQNELADKNVFVNLTDLSEGIYILKLTDDKNKTGMYKIIKN